MAFWKSNEDSLDEYAIELELFEAGQLEQALWVKHFVAAEGDAEKAKWKYLKERVAKTSRTRRRQDNLIAKLASPEAAEWQPEVRALMSQLEREKVLEGQHTEQSLFNKLRNTASQGKFSEEELFVLEVFKSPPPRFFGATRAKHASSVDETALFQECLRDFSATTTFYEKKERFNEYLRQRQEAYWVSIREIATEQKLS